MGAVVIKVEGVKAFNGADDGGADDCVVDIVGEMMLVVLEVDDGEDLVDRTGSVFVPYILSIQS